MSYFIFELYDFFQNILINNFYIKIHALKYNNYLYYTNIILIPFIPIKMLLNFFQIDIIYSIDNLYFITNCYNIINPVIFKFEILDSNKDIINITKKIKNYNGMIPLNFILKNYSVDPMYIRINYLCDEVIVEKEIQINNFDNTILLHHIFN